MKGNDAVVIAELLQMEAEVDAKAEMALHAAAADIVDFATSNTATMRPPATRNAAGNYIRVADRGGPRQAHPGGWADISSNLANSYGSTVEAEANSTFRLTIFNTAEYAAALESHDGYWVVSGLFEGYVQDRIEYHVRSAFNR